MFVEVKMYVFGEPIPVSINTNHIVKFYSWDEDKTVVYFRDHEGFTVETLQTDYKSFKAIIKEGEKC